MRANFLLVFSFISFLILGGCAGQKKIAIFLDNEFNHQMVDSIVVLPVVDLRVDKEKELDDLDDWVQDFVEESLEDYGYTVILNKDRDLIENINENDISSPKKDWIMSIGHKDDRWIFLPVLNDAMSQLNFGSTGNAEMLGLFFDKQQGTVIWRDKGIGKVGMGGLIGMALKGVMLHDSIISATYYLMESFPSKNF